MRILIAAVLIWVPALASAQVTATDPQTLHAILAEIRQVRHDLLASTAMTSRVQIALYRLQRQNEAVALAMQRVSDARSNVANLETEKNNKLIEIEQARNAASHSDTPNATSGFEEVVLPALKSKIELLRKQEQRARSEESEAEQHLREEQTKLDGLNDLLNRYNNALEDVGKR
ncbi:MAG: hypothetical protein JO356_20700 [Acidobacteria bacterium]|nr:hypothetical protein [Acidobacteriota bacterium]